MRFWVAREGGYLVSAMAKFGRVLVAVVVEFLWRRWFWKVFVLKALEGISGLIFVVVFGSGRSMRKVVAWVSECIQKKMGCEEENLVLIPSLSTDFNGVCGQRNGFLPPMAEHGRGDGVGLRPQGMVVKVRSPWDVMWRFEKRRGGWPVVLL